MASNSDTSPSVSHVAAYNSSAEYTSHTCNSKAQNAQPSW